VFTALPLCLPQHADEHRPKRPVLLAVDQQLGESAALWVAEAGSALGHRYSCAAILPIEVIGMILEIQDLVYVRRVAEEDETTPARRKGNRLRLCLYFSSVAE
jgi:hypothetical protein